MATRMSLWRLTEGGSAIVVSEEALVSEEQIESAVESAPELLGIDLMIIGRQTQTPSGPLDLLAIDDDARLVVIENKRNRTPREVLAQVIDYAAWVAKLTFDEVEAIYDKYRRMSSGDDGSDLAADFEERFGERLDSIGDVPRMIVVAAHLDDSTERMIAFLNDSFDVPVNAVLFQAFEGGLLGRTWLRPDVEGARSSGKRSSPSSVAIEQQRQFWEAWLPFGREVLDDTRLPAKGPKASWIDRIITPGIPASIQVWVTSSAAYAAVQFNDSDPQINASLLSALEERRSEIEKAYGAELEWRSLASSARQTRSTKVVAPRDDIGERTEPHADGLRKLAHSARRLVDAVKPYLAEAFEAASS